MSIQITADYNDPIQIFRQWYDQAKCTAWRRGLLRMLYPPAILHQPDAMTLATVGPDGAPHARVVLFKGLSDSGFTFFTNYESAKAGDLRAKPQVALVFHWQMPERQIRVEGRVSLLSDKESDRYWKSRPRGSQIAAWASDQSRPIAAPEALRDAVHRQTERFRNQEIPRPPHWGGYRVEPERIEFWQARIFRLHDRIVYVRSTDGWKVTRLAP